ncbi:fimbrial protein [Canicola haemoglobinophilus]|uniref:Competence protein B n=1 Tax=Canicola haemoglobinophilus TaxID=733 RepID=A0A1V4AYK8_9PAST|nr:fimbrial protein [Canicola haemoglobinophilus]OOR97110.1 fimbrial protein [Canicola haemoglobinophilus]STO58875.1 competence protein B [Canicola haemoglobinophilus]
MRHLAINLLPWRQEIYQQQIKSFIYKAILSLTFCIGSIAFILFLTQQIESEIAHKREQIQQIDHQLVEVKQQTSALQKNYSAELQTLKKIPTEQFLSILTVVSQLPLRHGELKDLSLDFDKLILQGETEQHHEFEQLQQFLKQQKLFSNVKLLTFKEQQIDKKRAVIFALELSLNKLKE